MFIKLSRTPYVGTELSHVFYSYILCLTLSIFLLQSWVFSDAIFLSFLNSDIVVEVVGFLFSAVCLIRENSVTSSGIGTRCVWSCHLQPSLGLWRKPVQNTRSLTLLSSCLTDVCNLHSLCGELELDVIDLFGERSPKIEMKLSNSPQTLQITLWFSCPHH